MKIYYNKDANRDIVKGKKIAIIGYGSQGHAHANNLKESGFDVIVAEFPQGGANWVKAEKAGHTVMTTAEAVKAAVIARGLYPNPVVTEIVAATTWYEAERYHQEYFARNPLQGYCQFVVTPKVAKFRKQFVSKLKP